MRLTEKLQLVGDPKLLAATILRGKKQLRHIFIDLTGTWVLILNVLSVPKNMTTMYRTHFFNS